MCCGCLCKVIVCIVILIVAIGLLFGFGVFKKAVHGVENHGKFEVFGAPPPYSSGRPFFNGVP